MLTVKQILRVIRMESQTTEPEDGFGHHRTRPISPPKVESNRVADQVEHVVGDDEDLNRD